jgi:hypothetical protein
MRSVQGEPREEGQKDNRAMLHAHAHVPQLSMRSYSRGLMLESGAEESLKEKPDLPYQNTHEH